MKMAVKTLKAMKGMVMKPKYLSSMALQGLLRVQVKGLTRLIIWSA